MSPIKRNDKFCCVAAIKEKKMPKIKIPNGIKITKSLKSLKNSFIIFLSENS